MRSSKLPECIVMVQTMPGSCNDGHFHSKLQGFAGPLPAASRAVRRRPYAEGRAPKGHGRSTAPGPEQPVGHGLALYKNGSGPCPKQPPAWYYLKTAAASSRQKRFPGPPTCRGQ